MSTGDTLLTRREAVGRIFALTGGAMIGADFFLSGCSRTDKTLTAGFTPGQWAMMDEIADTIIPATDSPGARAAGVGAVMGKLVQDCYSDEEHAAFVDGLLRVDTLSRSHYNLDFAACAPAQKLELLTGLDHEATAARHAKPKGRLPHYFSMMKELTLLGYFTSKIGCTQALQYVETPGRYDGNVPYHPGDKAWSGNTVRVG
jgi:hypothetical protein